MRSRTPMHEHVPHARSEEGTAVRPTESACGRHVAVAQLFCRDPVAGVRRVDFRTLANNGSPRYMGLAAAAFSSEARDAGVGDLNCDTRVDGLDLALLLGGWTG